MLFEYGYHYAYLSRNDSLRSEILNRFQKGKDEIRLAVASAGLQREQMDFIVFMLSHFELVFEFPDNQRKKLDLHFSAQRYVESFPQSNQNVLVEKLHGKFLEPSWFALEANLDFIYIQRSKGLSEHLSQNFAAAPEIRAYIHSTFLGLRLIPIVHPIMSDVNTSSGGQLFAGDTLRSFNFRFVLGRQFHLNKYLYVSPFVGYDLGQNIYANHSSAGVQMMKPYSHRFLSGFDCYIFFKAQPTRTTLLTKRPRTLTQNSMYLKMGFTYNQSQFPRISPEFTGAYNFIHFGFGVFLRNSKGVVVDRNRIIN
jgi:hypothetical protein